MRKATNRKFSLLLLDIGGHIFIICLLWVVLRKENIQEPVFEKVISAKISTQPPSNLPPLNQATRDKIEKERRANEEAAWKKQQDILKKRYEAEEKQKQEDARKKLAEELKKKEQKELEKKEAEAKKSNLEKKKRELEAKKERDAKEAQKRKEKQAAERERERQRQEKLMADKRAREAAKREAAEKAAAESRRQANLSRHVSAAISARIETEWKKHLFSAIQFNDPNDKVHIKITVARDGRLISANITQRAKSENLNSKAVSLLKTISRSGYKFPAFDPGYNENSMTLTYRLSAEE